MFNERKVGIQIQNVALIGCPASGKSTIAAYLAKLVSSEFLDVGQQIIRRIGMILELWVIYGEIEFRKIEE